jgi:hypothetical protein
MTLAFLIQTVVSLIAVLLLAGLAWWARIARHAPDLDSDTARVLLAEEFPDHALGSVWVSADGRAALARSEDEALIVYRAGDGYVTRHLPWARLADSKPSDGKVALRLGDFTAPLVRFALAEGTAWPPTTPSLGGGAA